MPQRAPSSPGISQFSSTVYWNERKQPSMETELRPSQQLSVKWPNQAKSNLIRKPSRSCLAQSCWGFVYRIYLRKGIVKPTSELLPQNFLNRVFRGHHPTRTPPTHNLLHFANLSTFSYESMGQRAPKAKTQQHYILP